MRLTRLPLLALCAAATAAFAIPPGTVAPSFTGTDSNGQTHSLSDFKGKFVVLEWANKGCPYEQKLYNSGTMEKLQHEWTGKGIVWLSILSSGPGQQGNVTPSEENAYLAQMKAGPTAAILDPSGTIGRLYQAKTTPHMFVINPDGKVIYQGAIDDKPSPDPDTLPGARNYVSEALTAAMSGKPVATPMTHSYGCSVKYAQ